MRQLTFKKIWLDGTRDPIDQQEYTARSRYNPLWKNAIRFQIGFDGSATLSHNFSLILLLDTSLSKRIWSLLLQFSITIINHIVSIIILDFYHYKTKKQNLPDGPSLAEVPKGLQKVNWVKEERMSWSATTLLPTSFKMFQHSCTA